MKLRPQISTEEFVQRVFFPVSEHTFYFEREKYEDNKETLDWIKHRNAKMATNGSDDAKLHIFTDRYKAIVSDTENYVYYAATQNWDLITNQEAMEKANIVAERVFGYKSLLDVEEKSFSLSYTGSQCIMRFALDEYFSNTEEDDVWEPTLIIHNSYNGTIKLRYTFGFSIKDSNIVIIFDSLNFNLVFDHKKSEYDRIEDAFKKKIKNEKWGNAKTIKEYFIDNVKKLKKIFLDDDDFYPLAFKLLIKDSDMHKLDEDENDDDLSESEKEKIIENKQKILEWYHSLVCAHNTLNKKNNLYYFMKTLAYFVAENPKIDKDKKSKDSEDDSNPERVSNYQNSIGSLMETLIEKLYHTDREVSEYVDKKYYEFWQKLKKLKTH